MGGAVWSPAARVGVARMCGTEVASPTPATVLHERVNVAHILVASEELARLVVEKLEESSFFELAESVSQCESAAVGGELGWLSRGLMVPQFDGVAFRSEVGSVQVFESDIGWHVLKVNAASDVPLEMQPTELRTSIEQLSNETEGHTRIQLIDIRDDEELAQARIPGNAFRELSYNSWPEWMPLLLEGTLPEGPQFDPTVETVVMDHRGGRGERIAQYLSQNSFLKARFVRGGIDAYAVEADPSVPVYLESDGDCLTCNEH